MRGIWFMVYDTEVAINEIVTGKLNKKLEESRVYIELATNTAAFTHCVPPLSFLVYSVRFSKVTSPSGQGNQIKDNFINSSAQDLEFAMTLDKSWTKITNKVKVEVSRKELQVVFNNVLLNLARIY
ncbi:hypothetical protein HanRHA438_Chr03g0116691 [Helianthus annuus]|nr:hypothetical protein HanRHA438_Chr03g0116691 [Helianthus annuus]